MHCSWMILIRSSALCTRWSGSLAIMRSMVKETPRGVAGTRLIRGFRGSFMCMWSNCRGVDASKGGWPAIMWYQVAPRE